VTGLSNGFLRRDRSRGISLVLYILEAASHPEDDKLEEIDPRIVDLLAQRVVHENVHERVHLREGMKDR
jgi:hypothetical protein